MSEILWKLCIILQIRYKYKNKIKSYLNKIKKSLNNPFELV